MLYFVNWRFKYIDMHDESITIDNHFSLKYENEDWRVYIQQLGFIFWLKRFLHLSEMSFKYFIYFHMMTWKWNTVIKQIAIIVFIDFILYDSIVLFTLNYFALKHIF